MATGPAPKIEKHRRRGQSLGNTGANIRLPKGGRRGREPRWPLGEASGREREIWYRLWRTPHAVAWEEFGWTDVVARYTRVLTMAEAPDPGDWKEKAALKGAWAEARQLEDRLGLTPMAMARLRWVIADEEEEESKESAPDVRQRLRAM